MRPVAPPRWLPALLIALATLVLGSLDGRQLTAGPGVPHVAEPIVATVYGGALTLTGSGFGAASTGSVRFDYGARSQALDGGSRLVASWQDDRIELSLPPEVQSGELTVVAGGTESEPADLLVFHYSSIALPPSVGTNAVPLAVAVGPDGTLWVNEEFHLELKSFSPGVSSEPAAVEIPQAPGRGIFAQIVFGNSRSRFSSLGEDVVVDKAGGVWFTQGGANYYYDGPYFNTSRIVRYDPAAAGFACYNVPADSAEVMGVLVDKGRGMVWYSEAGFAPGAAIAGFVPHPALSDCSFDPYAGGERPPLCSAEVAAPCHLRLPLANPFSSPAHLAVDAAGNIWFTEFWNDAVARLSPETGEIIELPLPPPIVRQGPGIIVGSGPWELAFDESGDLWVGEYFDATVLRVRPSLLESEDCRHLDAEGRNPCVEEVLVASTGVDGRTLRTVSVGADGLVWFGIETDNDGVFGAEAASVGFISPQHDDAVVLLPPIAGLNSVTGIAQDPSTRDLWFAQFWDKRVGRLQLLGAGDADADGVPDVEDNCVVASNPEQTDFDGDGIGSACDRTDTDGDGCTDDAEMGPNPLTGGLRDPLNPWDYFNPTGDGQNRMDDMLAVVTHYYANEGDPGYSIAYDRGGIVGAYPWNLGPPNGRVRVEDILGVLNSLYHDCVRPA